MLVALFMTVKAELVGVETYETLDEICEAYGFVHREEAVLKANGLWHEVVGAYPHCGQLIAVCVVNRPTLTVPSPYDEVFTVPGMLSKLPNGASTACADHLYAGDPETPPFDPLYPDTMRPGEGIGFRSNHAGE